MVNQQFEPFLGYLNTKSNPARPVNQFNPLDLFEEGREGRNLIFQTFLNRFRPGDQSFGVRRENAGLVTPFNRPSFSFLGNQAQNEFLGATGRAIELGQEVPTFTEFLNNGFNLGRRARRAPTQQMGTGTSRFASPARFLFNQ